MEDFYRPDEQTKISKPEYKNSKRNIGGTTHVATNLRSYLNPITPERDPEGSRNGNGHRSHRKQWILAKERHARHGSRWSESEAT